MECPMGNSPKFPIRPWGVSEEKTWEKPGKKKGAENYLRYTSRYVTSYKVISGDIISGDVTSGETTSGDIISGDITVPHNFSNTRPIQHDILLI